MLKWVYLAIFSLFLTACGSNPQSYITGKSKPIVNIEAEVNPQIAVKANSDSLQLRNISDSTIQIAYQLFWYDRNGVTQTPNSDQGNSAQEGSGWQQLSLTAQTSQAIPLEKPTPESENYRIYIKKSK